MKRPTNNIHSPQHHNRASALYGLAFSLVALLTGCLNSQSTVTSSKVVIDNVTVLDGQGGAPKINMRVQVDNGIITSISKVSGYSPRKGERIDGTGKFLLPGFIDMHAHLLFPRCVAGEGPPTFNRALSEKVLSRQLDFGITTVRSPATPTTEGLALRDDLNAGQVRGPRAFASAELINDANLSDDQLRQVVRDALPSKPDYIKVYARLRPSQVAVVVDEAHRLNLPVIGHLQRTSWSEGVSLGVDHLAHAVDWSVDSLPPERREAFRTAAAGRRGFRSRIDWLEAFDPDSLAQQKLVQDLSKAGTSVDVTLLAYDGKFSPPQSTRYRKNPFLASFPELKEEWENCDNATADWTTGDYSRWLAARTKLFTWVKRMSDGGVLLVTGTDMTNQWVIPGEGLHQEFELLAEAGLSPAQILRMTGANAAKSLRRNDVGEIAVGRRADLVLLSRDPLQNISNTRSILWVMQGGKIVVRGAPTP